MNHIGWNLYEKMQMNRMKMSDRKQIAGSIQIVQLYLIKITN